MYCIHPFQKIKLPWLGKTGLLWVQDYQSLHSRVPNTTAWTPTGPSSSSSINSSAFTTDPEFVIFGEVFFVALHKRSNKVSITFSFTLTSSWFYALLGVLTFILLELAHFVLYQESLFGTSGEQLKPWEPWNVDHFQPFSSTSTIIWHPQQHLVLVHRQTCCFHLSHSKKTLWYSQNNYVIMITEFVLHIYQEISRSSSLRLIKGGFPLLLKLCIGYACAWIWLALHAYVKYNRLYRWLTLNIKVKSGSTLHLMVLFIQSLVFYLIFSHVKPLKFMCISNA